MHFLASKVYFSLLNDAKQANLFQLKKKQCSKDLWVCCTVKAAKARTSHCSLLLTGQGAWEIVTTKPNFCTSCS